VTTLLIKPVRVLVTGSRTWDNSELMFAVLDGMLLATTAQYLTVVHGACTRGADAIADDWCARRGVPVQRFPANWQRYGDAAGPIRNKAMVASGVNRCVAFIRDNSPGATGCANLADASGIFTIRFLTGGMR